MQTVKSGFMLTHWFHLVYLNFLERQDIYSSLSLYFVINVIFFFVLSVGIWKR